MNILLYRYGSICEPDIIDGFNELGYQVYQITEEIYNKDMTPKQILDCVSKFLLSHACDVVFTINFFPIISNVCQIFKIPYISWTVDSPVMELFSKSIQNDCNRIFIFDREQYNEIEKLNPGHVFHFPLATNITSKQKVIRSASASIRNNYSADVSFVGSLYTEKNPFNRLKNTSEYTRGYIDALLNAQLNIYGYFFIQEQLPKEIIEDLKNNLPNYYHMSFENFLTDEIILSQLYLGTQVSVMERQKLLEALSNNFSVNIYTGSDTSRLPKIHNRGFANTLNEMPIIFKNSKINLNPTAKSIRSGISLRIFDIMACEGFVLSNYQTELSEFFISGEEFDYYTSIDEAVDKTYFYLEHDSIRKEIANTAYKKVCEHYNYPRRLSEMMNIVFSQ